MLRDQCPRFSILGDSISTFYGYTPADGVFYHPAFSRTTGVTSLADTWWMKVIEGCGGELLVNHSYAGSTVCRDGYQAASSPWRIAKLRRDQMDPDYILIYSGLNDVAFYRTPAEFQSNYTSMLYEMKSVYPHAQVWCGTLCRGMLENPAIAPFIQFNHCTPLSEYNESICSAVLETDCYLADLASFEQEYHSIDGVHPNASGMEQIAHMWLRCLLTE